jgi:predicted nucleic acid-binding protein
MVILDTSVIIDHLRQTGKKQSSLMKFAAKSPKESLTLSVISVQELYEGQSTRNEKQEQLLLATISPLKILPYTYQIAKLAGTVARDLKGPIELADAAIAATAISNGAELLTLNKKDFQHIPKLVLAELSD